MAQTHQNIFGISEALATMTILQMLFVALAFFTVVFTVLWYQEARRTRLFSQPGLWTGWRECGIGLFTLFLDTLGIGAFATTTALYRVWGLVADEALPGTLNLGITLPAVAQGYISMSVVNVVPKTLTLMVIAAAAGAWFGAGIVSRWPRRKIQIGMGTTLFVTAGFLLLRQFELLPAGGELMGIDGLRLFVAVTANLLLGALMTLGIGFFAPCMMVVYLLGMSPRAAFPIMMGSCAFLGTVGSIRFIRQSRYNWRAAIGMTIGGIPGVLIAAYFVRSLPLYGLRWLVFCVMIYTGFNMLRAAGRERAGSLSVEAKPSPAEA